MSLSCTVSEIAVRWSKITDFNVFELYLATPFDVGKLVEFLGCLSYTRTTAFLRSYI